MRKMTMVAALAGCASLVLAAPTAQASGTKADPRPVVTSEAAMELIGFDTATAAKAGNTITTEAGYQVLRDGRTGAVLGRIGAKGGPDNAPANTVYGNCGSSFFYLYDLSGARFALRTGFTVTANAFDFRWRTRTIGQNSFQTDNWEWGDDGPMWPSRSWSSGYKESTQDTYAGTYYYGRVTSGTAYLVNGKICSTGYPNDGKVLYK